MTKKTKAQKELIEQSERLMLSIERFSNVKATSEIESLDLLLTDLSLLLSRLVDKREISINGKRDSKHMLTGKSKLEFKANSDLSRMLKLDVITSITGM